MGWRYFVLAIGIITLVMFCIRFFVFHLFESPKFLLSRGRQAEAVAVVHGLAHRNGAKTWLTEDILDAVVEEGGEGEGEEGEEEGYPSSRHDHHQRPTRDHLLSSSGPHSLSTKSVLKARLANFSGARLRPLFSTRKLGLATSLIWFCWATIGMGYPLFNAFLPQYLSHNNNNNNSSSQESSSSSSSTTTTTTDPTAISAETYRNYAILSIVGVPGSILAYFTVDSPSAFLGRRGTLAISTFVSAGFLFLFVNYGTTSGPAQLAFSCVEAFSQNIMYGVLYAFTPEIL